MRFSYLNLALHRASSALATPTINSTHTRLGHSRRSGIDIGANAGASLGAGGAPSADASTHGRLADSPPGNINALKPVPILSDALGFVGNILGLNVTTGVGVGSGRPGDLHTGAYICIDCTCFSASADAGLGSDGHGVDTQAGADAQVWTDEQCNKAPQDVPTDPVPQPDGELPEWLDRWPQISEYPWTPSPGAPAFVLPTAFPSHLDQSPSTSLAQPSTGLAMPTGSPSEPTPGASVSMPMSSTTSSEILPSSVSSSLDGASSSAQLSESTTTDVATGSSQSSAASTETSQESTTSALMSLSTSAISSQPSESSSWPLPNQPASSGSWSLPSSPSSSTTPGNVDPRPSTTTSVLVSTTITTNLQRVTTTIIRSGGPMGPPKTIVATMTMPGQPGVVGTPENTKAEEKRKLLMGLLIPLFVGIPGVIGGALALKFLHTKGIFGNLIHSSASFVKWLTNLHPHLTGLGHKRPSLNDPFLDPQEFFPDEPEFLPEPGLTPPFGKPPNVAKPPGLPTIPEEPEPEEPKPEPRPEEPNPEEPNPEEPNPEEPNPEEPNPEEPKPEEPNPEEPNPEEPNPEEPKPEEPEPEEPEPAEPEPTEPDPHPEPDPDDNKDDDLCDPVATQARREFKMDFPKGFTSIENVVAGADGFTARTSGLSAFINSASNQAYFNQWPAAALKPQYEKILEDLINEQPEKYGRLQGGPDGAPEPELLAAIIQRYWKTNGVKARIGFLQKGPQHSTLFPTIFTDQEQPATARILWILVSDNGQRWYQGLRHINDDLVANDMDQYWQHWLGTADSDAFTSECLAGQPPNESPGKGSDDDGTDTPKANEPADGPCPKEPTKVLLNRSKLKKDFPRGLESLQTSGAQNLCGLFAAQLSIQNQPEFAGVRVPTVKELLKIWRKFQKQDESPGNQNSDWFEGTQLAYILQNYLADQKVSARIGYVAPSSGYLLFPTIHSPLPEHDNAEKVLWLYNHLDLHWEGVKPSDEEPDHMKEYWERFIGSDDKFAKCAQAPQKPDGPSSPTSSLYGTTSVPSETQQPSGSGPVSSPALQTSETSMPSITATPSSPASSPDSQSSGTAVPSTTDMAPSSQATIFPTTTSGSEPAPETTETSAPSATNSLDGPGESTTPTTGATSVQFTTSATSSSQSASPTTSTAESSSPPASETSEMSAPTVTAPLDGPGGPSSPQTGVTTVQPTTATSFAAPSSQPASQPASTTSSLPATLTLDPSLAPFCTAVPDLRKQKLNRGFLAKILVELNFDPGLGEYRNPEASRSFVRELVEHRDKLCWAIMVVQRDIEQAEAFLRRAKPDQITEHRLELVEREKVIFARLREMLHLTVDDLPPLEPTTKPAMPPTPTPVATSTEPATTSTTSIATPSPAPPALSHTFPTFDEFCEPGLYAQIPEDALIVEDIMDAVAGALAIGAETRLDGLHLNVVQLCKSTYSIARRMWHDNLLSLVVVKKGGKESNWYHELVEHEAIALDALAKLWRPYPQYEWFTKKPTAGDRLEGQSVEMESAEALAIRGVGGSLLDGSTAITRPVTAVTTGLRRARVTTTW